MNKLLRCNDCRTPVVWFRTWTGSWRLFDAKPVDGRTHAGAPAFPVDSRRAWKVRDLVEDLQARRETTLEAAEAEAYDMPWHVPHECPPGTTTTTDDPAAERTS